MAQTLQESVAFARYARAVIWEPFVLALVLGLLVSAGLYFAYMWPDVELADDGALSAAPTAPTPAVATTPVEPEPDPPSPTEPATPTAEAEVDAW
ncbi:MAG: hypothetical protein NT062_01565 [Proteobacteria bacterium]|nr:hypothetical protein [Pseudomonadota bacterium]